MAGVADSAVGAILTIPPELLNDIKDAEKAIKSLQATSETAARKIKGHFDNTAVSGLNAFIKKVEDAKNRLGNVKMPTIDATGFATSISQIAQAMATVDKSATTGANRLSRIADSITKLSAAQPNPQVFQDIANGISAIGNMSQQTIANVSQLAQTMAQLAKNINTVQNAQRALNNDTASAAQYNKLYKEQADLVRQKNELERKGASITMEEQRRLDAIKNRYAEISAQLDALNKKKQTAATELARIAGEQRVGGATSRTTVSGAIDYARQAKSLRELQDAYKNLKQVMQTVDPKSDAWQRMNVALRETKSKIDGIRTAMGEFHNQANRTNDVLGNLKGQIAAAFSVSAIYGFIKKMVEVRGQFELQNVALRAILQNKDEADKIFMQVQQMALQSPFSIMQMTTFTKQLAAYRIESEKLVDTTKMLADVSAGLGVDMGRLILAYGQVKSANYLRATEIRQFTEAGLNIAGELAQYFSELQGKMVSVGDVMEMVTKRMVRFEDVEEVFKRVTSAGGLFYDMQKKQSNTISGMLQRITDAWQIMLNDIGKSNQGLIRDALDLIRQMISHWRMLVPIIKTVGGLMATAFAVKGIYAALMGMTKMVAAIKAVTGGLTAMRVAAEGAKLAWSTTPIGVLITLGLTLTSVFMGLNAEAGKLNEELERIGSESFDDMNTAIANYVRIADTIRSTNVSYTERQEAIEELNRTYKDVLPTYLKEREYIDGNADSYAAATKKIKEYYQAKEYEKKVAAIRESDDYTKMLEHLKGLGERMVKYGWFDEGVSKEMVNSFMQQLANELMSGETEATMEAVANRMREYFGDHLKEVGNYVKWFGQDFKEGGLLDILGEAYGLDDLEDAFDRLEKIINKIHEAQYGLTTATSLEEQYAAAAKMHAKEVIDGAQEQVNKINAQIQAYFALKTELEGLRAKGQWSADEKDRMTILREKIKEASASFFNMADNVIPGLDRAFLSNINNVFDLGKALDVVSQKAFPTLAAQGVNALNPVKGEVNALTQAVNMLLTQLGIAGQLVGDKGPYTAKDAPKVLSPEEQQKWADKQNALWQQEQRNLQKRVQERKKSNQEILQDEAKRFGIEKALSDKQLLIQERTNKEYANDLRALAKTKEETLKDWDAGDARARKLMGVTDAEIEQMRKEVKFLQAVAKEYDPYDDKAKHKKGKDEIAELWKNRLKAIQDFYKRYEELRKHFDETESLNRAKDAFQGLFDVLDMDMDKTISFGMDKQGLANNIKDMLAVVRNVRPKLADEFEKAFADVQIQVDFKVAEDNEEKLKRQLDDMFASYELSKELKKLGLSVDLVFMLGGEPLDLNDLRAKVTKMYQDAGGEKASENTVKEYKDRLKKIEELELKERKERVKEYHKYFVKTVGERAQIELEYLKKMDDVRKMYEFTDAQRQDALRQLTEEKNRKLADQVWKDFKDGEIYQMMFKDLDNISEKALVTMRTELERIRDSFKSLSPHDLKEINKAINDINKQIVDRNPFKSLADSFKDLSRYAKERKNLEKDFQDAVKRSGELMDEIAEKESKLSQLREKSSLYKIDQIDSEINNLKKQIAELEKEGVTSEEQAKIDALNEQIKLLEEKKKKLQEIAALNQSEEDSMHSEIKGLESQVAGLNVELGESNNKAEESGKKLSAGAQKAKDISTAFGKIRQQAEGMLSEINGIIDGLDRMGVLSDAFKDTWGSVNDIFSGVMDIAEGGAQAVAGFMSGDIVGGIAGALKSIKGAVNAVASIFEIGDKSKERQIKKLKESVEALDKAYQKLEKSIEAAYTFSDYNAGYKQMQQSLEAEKTAYQEMIRLEEAKKKSDKEKIKEYEDKLDEIAEKEEELRKKRHEMYGSTDDVWSEANNWVDAWLDVFKEYGTGLDSLNDSWDEFYENLVKKQATSAIVSRRMEGFIDDINKAIDKNMTEYGYVDAFKDIGERFKKEFGDMNQQLIDFFNYAGITGGKGELILSDLQKGIQNITEPQAAAIEAYLNSMRFAVFTHTEQLERLIATVQAQYGSGAENPVVTELKGIRGVLDNIYRDLHSVVKSGVGKTYIQVG